MEVLAAGISWLISGPLNATWLGLLGSQTPLASNAGLDIRQELGSIISSEAVINVPGSDRFEQVTERWLGLTKPTSLAAVEVASERDIELTIQYANEHSLPFMAQSGGHGMWTGASEMRDGILISMRKLNSVILDADSGGRTAIIGGGTLVEEFIDKLWEYRKYAATGLCACTSIVGPALGGGHGALQGAKGLMADNIESMRLVLANATTIDVSQDSNEDLFWAMRGAGHNFGIVSSVRYKVFDVPDTDTWHVEKFIFDGDRLDAVVRLMNRFMEDDLSDKLLLWLNIQSTPDSQGRPRLEVLIQHQTSALAHPYTSPLHLLSPTHHESLTLTSYPAVPNYLGFGSTTIGCQRGYNVEMATISLPGLNSSAMDNFYEVFAAHIEKPGMQNAFAMIEMYGTRAVRAVRAESTAVSREERGARVLVGALLTYPIPTPPHPNVRSPLAKASRGKMITVLAEGVDEKRYGKPGSYVNYADGEQSLEEMYGFEEWRLERLRDLKKKWDPERRFRWYAPI